MIFENLIELRDSWSSRHPAESGNWWGEEDSATGIAVTPITALANTPFHQGVEFISSMIAMLPHYANRRTPTGGVEREREGNLTNLLRWQPNPEATAYVHQKAQIANKLVWGDSYAEIEFGRDQNPVALWHIPSWLVTPRRVYKKPGGGLTVLATAATPEDRQRGGVLMYEVTDGQGGKPVWLTARQMFHVPGLSFNGIRGMSVLAVAKESIGIGLAMQKSGAAVFGNAARPDAVLERPVDAPPLSPTGERNMIAAWEAQHKGAHKTGRTAVLQEGTVYKPVMVNMKELQYAESLKNQVPEVARILNISPYFLGHDGAQNTYSNVEGEWIRLQRQTLMPHTTAIEQEVMRKLIHESDAATLSTEFEYKRLLQGDSAGRAAFYQILRGLGSITPAEIARLENLPEVPENQGGNDFRPPAAPSPFGASPAPDAPDPEKKPASPVPPELEEEDEEDNDEQRTARLRDGLRDMLAAAIQRGITREVKTLRKIVAGKKASLDEMRAAADEFYASEFPDFLTEITRPALGRGAENFARTFAASHTAELAERAGDPLAIADLLDAWSTTAATEAAAAEIARLEANLAA